MRPPRLLALPCALAAACAGPARAPVPAPRPATATATAAATAPRAASKVAPAPAPPPPTAPPGLRLPGDAHPVREAVELTLDPASSAFAGEAHLDVVVDRATSTIWLDATDLRVTSARIDGEPARVVAGGEDHVGLVAPRVLSPGPISVDVAYLGGIDHQRSRGIYAEAEGGEAYAYTFFEPIDARRAFPCFDEPAYKIPWALTFHVRADHVALGNAPVRRETYDGAGGKTVELFESAPLPAYLVAFVVGPFELVDGGKVGRGGTPLRFVVPRGRAGELGWARDVTPRAVAALEGYLDLPYPYAKLDVAVVPRFWGTMEHPGLVAIGQPLALIRPAQDGRARRQAYANILIHELAHQWFGDLVTPAWWDDTWLNESLGQWADLHVTDAVEPGWRYADERVGQAAEAMDADELLATQPIRLPVTTREAIAASFDGAITYLKGASVLRMFEAWVGRERWRDLIRGYLRAHAGGTATADDFLAAAAASLGGPAAQGLSSFLAQPGVPRIEARPACAPGEPPGIALRQRRALPLDVAEPTPRQWKVPVCVRYGADDGPARACALLADEETVLPTPGGCPAWILPNDDARGYYRSAVDEALVRGVFGGGPRGRAIPATVPERLMLVADLRAATARGELPLRARLAAAPLIAADPDDAVARAAVAAASLRDEALDEPLHAQHEAYLRATFGARAARLGWRRAPADDDRRHDLRRALVPLVARAGDRALRAQAGALVDAWLAGAGAGTAGGAPGAAAAGALPDDLVDAALAIAAEDGDAARFARYREAARRAPDRDAAARMLAALGAFAAAPLAERARALLLGDEVDLREALPLLAVQLRGRRTRDAAWRWLEGNLDALLARMRSDEASWLLGDLAAGACEAGRRAQAGALLLPRAARVDGAQAAVERGLQASDRCQALYARELPALRAFLGPRRGR